MPPARLTRPPPRAPSPSPPPPALTGHVLAKAPKGPTGKTTAALTDQVLPALTASITLLQPQAPKEADNLHRTVSVAAARTHQGRPSLTLADMARKITEALDAA
ncbi:hypothetical protein ABZ912_28040 [Nonomuraea angiospora]|uniref:hypothetical protein n=1 Tax=Nonomuraea angiospora TaxID=46172 RepID=UPI0033D4A870